MKQKFKTGDEYDMTSKRHRRFLFPSLLRRHSDEVKTRLRRRFRHEAKHAIRKDREDG